MTGRTERIPAPLSSILYRTDESLDPPSPAFVARLERDLVEGTSFLFMEERVPEDVLVGMFSLSCRDGVYRVGIVADERDGAFASVRAAVVHGWHMLDLRAAVVRALSRDELAEE